MKTSVSRIRAELAAHAGSATVQAGPADAGSATVQAGSADAGAAGNADKCGIKAGKRPQKQLKNLIFLLTESCL